MSIDWGRNAVVWDICNMQMEGLRLSDGGVVRFILFVVRTEWDGCFM